MKDLLKILVFFFVFITITMISGYPLKWLWNWLMPMIFELPEINFWQAAGLLFLSGLLLKNWDTKKLT